MREKNVLRCGMAGDYEINVRTNLKELHKEIEQESRDQIPYAAALAINSIAAKIVETEKKAFQEVFDKPTPFTMNAMGRTYANKNKPEAIVFVKDIQGRYLEPFEGFNGGHQVPHKDSILNPRGIKLNQYGNIPRNMIRTLLAVDLVNTKTAAKLTPRKIKKLQSNQKKYFVGSVVRKGQRISGVWERPDDRKGSLKLLVRFTDPKIVKEHLDYFKRADAIFDRYFDRILRLSLAHAIDTK